MEFDFTNETIVKIGKNVFENLFVRFSKFFEKKSGKISLIIVDDKKIRKINSEYRGFDEPTDVISFEYADDSFVVGGENIVAVGDIFISLDTAKRQAKEHGHSLDKEFEILFVHGLLHVIGFDHKNDKEEKEMEKQAKKILG
ncbi:MAG: rRNA maturation RNase YbeY [Candidatus Gracilibacteria bacterium]|jgi:probable rRNA maturation factor